MFKELRDHLSNEWISMQDICAIFAGFCPIEPYQPNYGRADPNRRYKRISDGEVVKLSQSDVKEIDNYLDKWAKSDFTNPRTNPDARVRDPRIIDGNDSEIRVRFAFEVGLGFRPEEEKICALYDAAVDEGLLPEEPSINPFGFPVVPHPDYTAKPWKVKELQRRRGYDFPLTKILQAYCENMLPPPSADQVLEAWEKHTTRGIVDVSEDRFYYLGEYNKKTPASRRSLKNAINRRVEWL